MSSSQVFRFLMFAGLFYLMIYGCAPTKRQVSMRNQELKDQVSEKRRDIGGVANEIRKLGIQVDLAREKTKEATAINRKYVGLELSDVARSRDMDLEQLSNEKHKTIAYQSKIKELEGAISGYEREAALIAEQRKNIPSTTRAGLSSPTRTRSKYRPPKKSTETKIKSFKGEPKTASQWRRAVPRARGSLTKRICIPLSDDDLWKRIPLQRSLYAYIDEQVENGHSGSLDVLIENWLEAQ